MRILHACFGSGRASEVAEGLGRAQAALLPPGGRVLVLGTIEEQERTTLDRGFRRSAWTVALAATHLPWETLEPGSPPGGVEVAGASPPAVEVLIQDEGALRSARVVLPSGLDGPAAWSWFTDVTLLVGPALLGGRPDVVHAHGHPLGLLPLRLRRPSSMAARRALGAARVVFSPGSLLEPHAIPKRWVQTLGLSWEEFSVQGFEWHDQLSLLKAGVAFADLVLCEGPEAAAALRTEDGGAGLHGFFAAQTHRVVGVTMGGEGAPALDRQGARAALLAEVDLPERGALIAVLPGPLRWAAGTDTVFFVAGRMAALGVQLAIVGRGSEEMERRALALAGGAGESVAACLTEDPAFLNAALRGADVCLLPHRLADSTEAVHRALRAGALPVAHAVGAHRDVLLPAAAPPPAPAPPPPAFLFAPHGAEPLLAAVAAAVVARADSVAWSARIAAAQAHDSSFAAAAAATLRLVRPSSE